MRAEGVSRASIYALFVLVKAFLKGLGELETQLTSIERKPLKVTELPSRLPPGVSGRSAPGLCLRLLRRLRHRRLGAPARALHRASRCEAGECDAG